MVELTGGRITGARGLYVGTLVVCPIKRHVLNAVETMELSSREEG